MSVSTTLYIGPYVVVENKEHPTTVKVRACTSNECPKKKPTNEWDVVKSPHCSQCGSKVGMIDITVMEHLSTYDVLEETERLTSTGQGDGDGPHVYLIVNEGKAYKKRDFHYEVDTHEDLGSLSMMEEVIWFEKRYAKELELLRAAYGHVTVLWGVHYYQW